MKCFIVLTLGLVISGLTTRECGLEGQPIFSDVITEIQRTRIPFSLMSEKCLMFSVEVVFDDGSVQSLKDYFGIFSCEQEDLRVFKNYAIRFRLQVKRDLKQNKD